MGTTCCCCCEQEESGGKERSHGVWFSWKQNGRGQCVFVAVLLVVLVEMMLGTAVVVLMVGEGEGGERGISSE